MSEPTGITSLEELPELIYNECTGLELVVRMDDGEPWLTQNQMAELFGVERNTVTEHIQHIIDSGEVKLDIATKTHLTLAADGKQYNIKHYSLEFITRIGFLVKSDAGIKFRDWVCNKVSDLLTKGLAVNKPVLLKNQSATEELSKLMDELEKTQLARLEERTFYDSLRKILCYATDYHVNPKVTQENFEMLQNMVHVATHGHTSAEIVILRCNSDEEFCGLRSWLINEKKKNPRKSDVTVGKNYMTFDELSRACTIIKSLVGMTMLYVVSEKKFTMQELITKLYNGLIIFELKVRQNYLDSPTREAANKYAHDQWATYRQRQLQSPKSV